MPHDSEFADYEPVTRPRTSNILDSEAPEDEWIRSRTNKSGSRLREVTSAIHRRREGALQTSRLKEGSIPGNEKRDKTESLKKNWILKRGHALSFACLFLFTVVLYFRPYELIPALSPVKSMAFYVALVTLIVFLPTQLSVEGNLTARPREVNLVLFLVLAALLSIPMAINPGEAWDKLNDTLIKAVIIFIVIVNVVHTKRRLKLLILLALAVSVYLSINAVNDYRHGIFKLGSLENNTNRVAGSIGGLFENSNDLALHLVTMVPIAFALALEKRGLPRKVVYLTTGVLMIAAIVVTFSRGGFLGLIASAFVFTRKLGRRNRVATTGVFVLAAILFVAFAPGAYSGRLSTIFDSGADITGSSSQRTEVLKRSVVVALRYPLFGVGIGNFHHRSIQELVTHNAYTQVATEIGLPAMICYMMFLLHPLKRLRQIEQETYDRSSERYFYYLAVGLQASLVGYMVASFFAAVAYQWYIYYLVGYAIALRRLYQYRLESNSQSHARFNICNATGRA